VDSREQGHIEALKAHVASEFAAQNVDGAGLNGALERGNQDVRCHQDSVP
jgi:hypothetical protein